MQSSILLVDPESCDMQQISLLLIMLAISVAPREGMAAPADGRPGILIVGTYHMTNRNHDLYNVQADDVLSPHAPAANRAAHGGTEEIPSDKNRS